MRRNRLVIMLKEPVAGRVKTRLGRDIGMTASAWWFRHQTSNLIRRMMQDPRWETSLSVAPDTGVASRFWPAGIRRTPQGAGDMGARMKRVLSTAPNGRVVLIGGDIPGITPRHIHQAFQALGQNDLVFGPSNDGGFWLAGAKQSGTPLPADLFRNVKWSSAQALADSLKTIGNNTVGYVETLQDVDTIDDLRQL